MSRNSNGTSDVCYKIVLPVSAGSAWSMGGWVEPANPGGSEQCFFCYGKSGATQDGGGLEILSSKFQYTDFAGARVDSGFVLSSGSDTWYHVIMTMDVTGFITIYVNGTSQNTGSGFTTATGHGGISAGAAIQQAIPSFNLFYQGNCAKLGLWSVQLSGTDVSNLAGGSNPTTIQPSSLKGYWALCGDVAPEPDTSGTGNSLTVVGTTKDINPPGTFVDCAGPPIPYLAEGGLITIGSGRWW